MNMRDQLTSFPFDPDIEFESRAHGAMRLHLLYQGNSVGHLQINPQHIRVGKAILSIGYLTDVWTEEMERGKGYGRRLQEAAIAWMRTRYELSLLHGIRDFYPKFGYTPCGPDHIIKLELHRVPSLPEGWKVRAVQRDDMPALQRLYRISTEGNVGAAIREENDQAWVTLARGTFDGEGDECRVIEHPDGHIVAYAWRGRPLWCVRLFERYDPDTLVLAEVMAEDHLAADVVLAACHLWAQEEKERTGKPIYHVTLSFPPEGPLAAATMLHDAKFLLNCFTDGGFMGQVLDTPRALQALQPELEARFRVVGLPFSGTLCLQTDRGSVKLIFASDSFSVVPVEMEPLGQGTNTLILAQTTLVRLILGAFFPEDLLTRCCPSISPSVKALLATLFPLRQPHIYLADRGVE